MGMTKPIHKAGETRAGFAVVMMIGHDGGLHPTARQHAAEVANPLQEGADSGR